MRFFVRVGLLRRKRHLPDSQFRVLKLQAVWLKPQRCSGYRFVQVQIFTR